MEIERGATFGVSSPGQVEITTSGRGRRGKGRGSVWAIIGWEKRAVNAKKIKKLIFIIIALFVGLIRRAKSK